MTPSRWPLAPLLFALGELFSCDRGPACGEFPNFPSEGQYTVQNPDDFPITFVSVTVACDELTFRYLDEDGAEQWVTYQIQDLMEKYD